MPLSLELQPNSETATLPQEHWEDNSSELSDDEFVHVCKQLLATLTPDELCSS